MTDSAADHVKTAREELTKARRHINEPDELAVKTDEQLGRIETMLNEMQLTVELVQDGD